MLIVTFIIRGLKEFGEPARKVLIMDLAPEDAKAETFGTYYLFRDVVVSIAALSSAFLWNISPFSTEKEIELTAVKSLNTFVKFFTSRTLLIVIT
ncbi:MAG: hypothetical protein ROY99_02675 [Ignavibacterium sp.]|jgi:hypothetical protein|nr:hypothetical protein [Ignavibacterium sp.]